MLRRQEREADLARAEGDVGMRDGRAEVDDGRLEGVGRWDRDVEEPEAVYASKQQ